MNAEMNNIEQCVPFEISEVTFLFVLPCFKNVFLHNNYHTIHYI